MVWTLPASCNDLLLKRQLVHGLILFHLGLGHLVDGQVKLGIFLLLILGQLLV
jgi:uncharacterized membrane protein